MRFSSSESGRITIALGVAQTIAWASSYYLAAVLAAPMARSFDLSPVYIYAAFSGALIVSAVVGPWVGARIDRFGGRGPLLASNLIFILGLGAMAASQTFAVLVCGWLIIGVAMSMGLYDSAFAALTRIYGRNARKPITGITLIAGFASTVGWPLTAFVEAQCGWRVACLSWIALHLFLALPLNALLPNVVSYEIGTSYPHQALTTPTKARADTRNIVLLSVVFAGGWFTSTAMAAHLPQLLGSAGATPLAALVASALIGPAQVTARVFEFALLARLSPLLSAQWSTLAHPIGAVCLLVLGGPAALLFSICHGAGNGILTISKGTVPLILFGPSGYGFLQGVLSAPAKISQAFAPLLFGFLLEQYGSNAIMITIAIGIISFFCMAALKQGESSN